ncbi:MAG TPA: PaaX family transcriptional regulator C-terminal domain-containing protein [Acidimicrobiales bacterium]|nr:PaaX family transcriptional regulator C-terminal domain-containing protein [Acidimicrobiales bacterium]
MAEASPPAAERTSQLVMTLLGDYWFATAEHVPSAALAALLAEFGVGAAATRAAIRRSTRGGWLEGIRSGRTTAYRLARAEHDRALARARHVMAFGAGPSAWDGTWTCVAFSIPEADRARRLALRKRLLGLGCGPLFDGLWITPHPATDELDRALRDLGVAGAAVLRVTEVPRTDGVDLRSAWNLAALRAGYQDYLGTLRDLAPRVDAMGPAQALVARTEVLVGWRNLVTGDPRLPDELLPADWPLAETRRRFVATYDALGPVAEARVRQLITPYAATPPPRHHTVDDVLLRTSDHVRSRQMR